MDELLTALRDAGAEPQGSAPDFAALVARGRRRGRRRTGMLAAGAATGVVVVALALTFVVRPAAPTVVLEPGPELSPGLVDPAEEGRDVDRLPAAPLSARTGAYSAWTGSELLIWGGYEGAGTPEEGAADDGAAYDPVADTWRALPPAPEGGAYGGTALWTGEELWVLGGFGDEAGRAAVASAQAYDPTSDRWRPLPDPPGPPGTFAGIGAVAWLGDGAVASIDGALWGLAPDGTAWEEVATAAQQRGVPPDTQLGSGVLLSEDVGGDLFALVDGDGGLRAVGLGRSAEAPWRSATRVGDEVVLVDPDGVVAVRLNDGTTRDLPTPQRLALGRLLTLDDAHVALVEPSGLVQVLDLRAGTWSEPIAPFDDGDGSVAAGAEGGVYLWGGSAAWATPDVAGVFVPVPSRQVTSDAEPAPEGTPVSSGAAGPAVAVEALAPPPLPAGTAGSVAAWSGQELLLWGGRTDAGAPEQAGPIGYGLVYDPSGDAWGRMDDGGPAASGSTALWTGDELWVLGGFGGEDGREELHSAAAYDPRADAWRALPDLPAAGAISGAWLGERAVVTIGGETWALAPTSDGWDPDYGLGAPPNTRLGDGVALLEPERGLLLMLVAGEGGGTTVLEIRRSAEPEWRAATRVGDDVVLIDGDGVAVFDAEEGSPRELPAPTAAPGPAPQLLTLDERTAALVGPGAVVQLLDVEAGAWSEPVDALPGVGAVAAAAGDGAVYLVAQGERDAAGARVTAER